MENAEIVSDSPMPRTYFTFSAIRSFPLSHAWFE